MTPRCRCAQRGAATCPFRTSDGSGPRDVAVNVQAKPRTMSTSLLSVSMAEDECSAKRTRDCAISRGCSPVEPFGFGSFKGPLDEIERVSKRHMGAFGSRFKAQPEPSVTMKHTDPASPKLTQLPDALIVPNSRLGRSFC